MMNNTPPVTKNLIIINILCSMAAFVFGDRFGMNLNDIFGLHYFESDKFELYQLFTYMFMHSGLDHIFFNMFALWMFGRILETVWGSQRFLFYYILCGLGAGLIQEGTQYIEFMPLMHRQASIHLFLHLPPIRQILPSPSTGLFIRLPNG